MDSETQRLIRRLRETHTALRSFLVLERQAKTWEADHSMVECLPNLYRRRDLAMTAYVEANGATKPLIAHDGIDLKTAERVINLLELGVAETVEDALSMLR